MRITVLHRITDPEKFMEMDAEEVAAGAPEGAKVQQFLPSEDHSVATCLWEASSVDEVRDYLDPATEGVAENTYFEIDEERALGLPAGAGASA